MLIIRRFPPPKPGNSTFRHANHMRMTFECLRAQLPAAVVLMFDDWTETYLDDILRSVNSCSEADIWEVLNLLSSPNRNHWIDM
jgi:hypothetical protein